MIQIQKPNEHSILQLWDIANIPRNITDEEKRELELAWQKIPTEFVQGINQIRIKNKKDIISYGSFVPYVNNINVDMGIDSSGVLIHEIHHHMWFNKRTVEQIENWCKGVRKIMKQYGKSPTGYSDHYCRKEMRTIQKENRILRQLQEKIDNDKITINVIFPELKDLKAHVSWCDKYKDEKSDLYYEYSEKIQEMKDCFANLTNEGKHIMAQKTLEKMKISFQKHDIQYREIFYNECHSEVGAFIYAENAMRERADYHDLSSTTKIGINEYVIQKYVELYKDIFGIMNEGMGV